MRNPQIPNWFHWLQGGGVGGQNLKPSFANINQKLQLHLDRRRVWQRCHRQRCSLCCWSLPQWAAERWKKGENDWWGIIHLYLWGTFIIPEKVWWCLQTERTRPSCFHCWNCWTQGGSQMAQNEGTPSTCLSRCQGTEKCPSVHLFSANRHFLDHGGASAN